MSQMYLNFFSPDLKVKPDPTNLPQRPARGGLFIHPVGAPGIAGCKHKRKVIRFKAEGGENMPSSYKDMLLKEISEFPEETIPKLYRIVHVLRRELMQNGEKPLIRGSLKGIWRGSEIDERLFLEAKRSLFLYETK